MKQEFVLSEVEALAPLVRRILSDVTEAYAAMRHVERRVDLLHSCRYSSKYDVRKQAHNANRDLTLAERRYETLSNELEDLGVTVLDPVHGVAGFPFLWSLKPDSKRVRQAYFLLKLWEDPEKRIRAWRFLGEDNERKVPRHWLEEFSPPSSSTNSVGTQSDQ